MAKTKSKAGDLAQLAAPKGKPTIITLKKGERLQTSAGVLQHDDLIGRPWGSQVQSHLGEPFFLLQPALDDLIRTVRRNTQTLYPKDIAYVLLSMGIGPDQEVVEAGTGSGAMTIALTHTVGKKGHVFSYERRPEIQDVARENLERLGLLDRVSLKLRDVEEGFDEKKVRALFMDLPNPEDYLAQVREALQAGGFFGCILPTANQVSVLLLALKKAGFAFLEVSEILHRYYKPVARRLRPADTMVAHTGFLVFARRVSTEATESE